MTRGLFGLLFLSLLPTLSRSQPTGDPPLPSKSPVERLDAPPIVSAKAWIIAEGKSGKMLWGYKETEPLVMASTTKIMTAWIVLRLAKDNPRVLDETIVVSERAAKTTGSGAKIKATEKYTVRDLLYGLLLPSGNDAATAIAEHFGKRLSEDGKANEDPATLFVAEMNREAAARKMTNTKYFDPHGLGKNHTSVKDLALLASHALKDPTFAKYVQTRRHQCEVSDAKGEKRTVTWNNTNQLLGIEGYDGVKTGTTTAAGSCLVASGHRESSHLIVVVLGCTSNDSRYVDSRNLFRWAWRELGKTQPGIKDSTER